MEGAIPHGLKTVEGPKVRKARGNHPQEAGVTTAQVLPASLMLQNPAPPTTSSARTSGDRVEPLTPTRRWQVPILLPPPIITWLCFFFGQVCFSSAYKQNNSEIKERDQEEKGKWIGTEAIRKKTD